MQSHGFSSLIFLCATLAGTKSTVALSGPRRLAENVAGPVFVNDKCINCAACSLFSPKVFQRSQTSDAHYVYHQPNSPHEIEEARAALAACPVASIRVDPKLSPDVARQMAQSPKFNELPLPFPRPLAPHVDNVYYVGHHSEKSFGAIPYLIHGTFHGKPVWVMVDTPRFGASSVKAVTSLTGPQGPGFLMLTHVDDTADHGRWAEEFPNLKRIFHSADLGRYNWIGDKTLEHVEILLQAKSTSQSLAAFQIDGTPYDSLQRALDDNNEELIILHTPGHSPGSITLFKKPQGDTSSPGILFTGDTYGYSVSAGGMSGFPRYGNNLQQQASTLKLLLTSTDWQMVAPGHGHSRDYRHEPDRHEAQAKELDQALAKFMSYGRW